MSASVETLDAWLDAKEGERFEFKEARNDFDFEKLTKYSVALANEGGGKIILGVTDKRPRQVVGSRAFEQPERMRQGLIERLPLRIDFDAIQHPNGRVLVIHVPARPVGTPIQYGGRFWMRDGDSLVEMSTDRLREIFAESGYDFSADICPGATLADLDYPAIEDFRQRWIEKSKNALLAALSHEQLLRDAEVLFDNGITYAALVLFGTRTGLGRFLAQAEVVFEYRSSDASGPAQERREFRRGFFSFYDELWIAVNLRNDKQHYQEGLFVLDVPTFTERSVREALLNAVSHRDYQLGGSIFVRQYPRRLEIVSPGGFPPGIQVSNILDRQSPRNRRVADVFMKCGLVERSGQGMNLIFEEAIAHSKPIPNFDQTDQYQVAITLGGVVQDANFVRFLVQVGKERLATFSTLDFLVLDLINRDQPLDDRARSRVPYLLEQGVVERVTRGNFVLSRRFYQLAGKKGVYTRKRGLDREQNKALLLRHIQDNDSAGSPLSELQQVLPGLTTTHVQSLLRALKKEGLAHPVGRTRQGRWFPGPPSQG
ncbi:MAG: ATP-binding protein [Planctomycetales bacterium]